MARRPSQDRPVFLSVYLIYLYLSHRSPNVSPTFLARLVPSSFLLAAKLDVWLQMYRARPGLCRIDINRLKTFGLELMIDLINWSAVGIVTVTD